MLKDSNPGVGEKDLTEQMAEASEKKGRTLALGDASSHIALKIHDIAGLVTNPNQSEQVRNALFDLIEGILKL